MQWDRVTEGINRPVLVLKASLQGRASGFEPRQAEEYPKEKNIVSSEKS
jgi:hypothetical protein